MTRSVPSHTNKKRAFSQLGKMHEQQETTQLLHELKRMKKELPAELSKEIAASLSKKESSGTKDVEAVVVKQLGKLRSINNDYN